MNIVVKTINSNYCSNIRTAKNNINVEQVLAGFNLHNSDIINYTD